MLLFRSEEHVRRWSGERGIPMGATMTPSQQWELAQAWYADRMSPSWRRRTPEEAGAVFHDLGLDGEFWKLTGS